MRRLTAANVAHWSTRALSGVAPVLYFPPTEAALPREAQIEKNTKVALEVIRRVKGPLPAPYTRKYSQTVEQIEKDIDALLGGAASLRKSIPDDTPMDKLTLMERCLRHALWSYYKSEGKHNFDEYRKWLVYTEEDEVQLAALRRQEDLASKQAAVKAKRLASGSTSSIPLPNINWTAEYDASVDREVVVEKRLRYDTLALNTTDRDEAAISALYQAYRKPMQDKRLDNLVEMLERFKPVLAREAILQRLTIKHLEGQLGIWRYLDWNPEVRDRCELESDNLYHAWLMYWEEKRLSNIRLRSKAEVTGVMAKSQEAQRVATGSAATEATTGDSTRDKLLKEVLALQARLSQREEKPPEAPKKRQAADHH